MTMLVEIILVEFFQIVLILVDMGKAMETGKAMRMAMRAVVLRVVTVLSHRVCSVYGFDIWFSTFRSQHSLRLKHPLCSPIM